MAKRVIGIGELLWDVLPKGKRLGGAPVNFIHYVGELGCEGYAVSAVGKDNSGDELLEAVRSNGISDKYIQRNDHPTSRVDVTLDAAGVPTYTIHENVAWDFLSCNEATTALVASTDAICWGSLAQRNATSRDAVLGMIDAAPKEALKVFDINLRQSYYDRKTIEASLQRANVLKLNDDELVVLSPMFSLTGDDEARLQQLLKIFTLRYIVYTMGAVGSLIVGSNGERSYLATPKVEVADTVGAGDSFTATFVAKLLNGATIAEAHLAAVEVAAYVCTCHGAINPLNK